MTQPRLHPLVGAAAASVLLVSLLGAAAITGILPTSHSSVSPANNPASNPSVSSLANPTATNSSNPQAVSQLAAAPVSTMTPAPAPAPRQVHSKHHSEVKQHSAAVKVQSTCANCGTVVAVNTIAHAAPQTSGVGVVAGALLGGVLGNQVGGGNGRKIATVAGAIGGGFAGNEVEKRTRTSNTYEVKVRMEDGSTRSFSHNSEPGWHSGDKVRVENGQLTSRA